MRKLLVILAMISMWFHQSSAASASEANGAQAGELPQASRQVAGSSQSYLSDPPSQLQSKYFGDEAQLRVFQPTSSYESPLAKAIRQAGRVGIIETGIRNSAKALVECQQEQSSLLTVPILRSDSQQNHCYRF